VLLLHSYYFGFCLTGILLQLFNVWLGLQGRTSADLLQHAFTSQMPFQSPISFVSAVKEYLDYNEKVEYAIVTVCL